ncbi:hypothetical protein BSKO_01820 [Bryopsis sp. KO-2023]|nr:hypothetical protein BSKO_01820 [Bryopsis sp. KO-2023]
MTGFGEEYKFHTVPPPPDQVRMTAQVGGDVQGEAAPSISGTMYDQQYWAPETSGNHVGEQQTGVPGAAEEIKTEQGVWPTDAGPVDIQGYPQVADASAHATNGSGAWNGVAGIAETQHQTVSVEQEGREEDTNAMQATYVGTTGMTAEAEDPTAMEIWENPMGVAGGLAPAQTFPSSTEFVGTSGSLAYDTGMPQPDGTGQMMGFGGEVAVSSGVEEEGQERRIERKRRNRWGPIESEVVQVVESGKKKRRSRWETADDTGTLAIVPKFPKELTLPGGIRVTLPPHLTGEPVHTDPELKALHERFGETNRKIINNELDIPPEHERSPSPEPVYDRNGVRLNTREVRMKDRLMQQRNEIIEELIMKDPNFKPPADYKPQKKSRKIYIPQKDFPGYNFIGLIIGPRGNTQKRMQKETNTKIAIRGKGSVKEGAARDPKYDYGEDEQLHVLITGDRQEDVDEAANMIEKLLQPVDEERNEHKRMQLRELAALNGTLKDDQTCYLCGDSGHRSYECPKKAPDVYKLPTHIQQKVDELYQKDVVRVRPEEAGKLDNEYQSFLAEVGGGPNQEAIAGQIPPPIMNSVPAQPRVKRPGDDLPDDCKLYVGNLAPAVNDTMLRQMFETFGEILHATVLMDLVTGASRGYGFVHFTNSGDSRASAEEMNGKVIDGRSLVVRLRSEGPPTSKPRYGTTEPDDCKLYVAHLPTTISESGLRGLFERYGEVREVKLITNRLTGEVKGYGFVNMASAEAAQAAIQGLNGYRLDSKILTVRIAGQRPANGLGSPTHGMPPPAPLPGVLTGFVPAGVAPGVQPTAAPGIVPVPPAPAVQVPPLAPLPPPRLGPPPPGVPPGVQAFPPPPLPLPLLSQAPPPQMYTGIQAYPAPYGLPVAYPPPPPQATPAPVAPAAPAPPGAPPIPEQPPLPSGPPPPAPPPPESLGTYENEYERFLQEMQGALPS